MRVLVFKPEHHVPRLQPLDPVDGFPQTGTTLFSKRWAVQSELLPRGGRRSANVLQLSLAIGKNLS
jgi:hypothetical protein